MSSISGSDSEEEESHSEHEREEEDDDDNSSFLGGRLSSRVLFQNSQGQYLCLYRNALQHRTVGL